MIGVNNLKTLVNLPNAPEDGEIALCTDSNNKYKYSAEVRDWIPYKEMTQYDYKKNIVSQFPIYDEEDNEKFIKFVNTIFEEDFNDLNTFIITSFADFSKYLTIIQPTEEAALTLGEITLYCLQEIGDIVSSEYNETNHGIEVWVRNFDDKLVQLFLVNYQEGVVFV